MIYEASEKCGFVTAILIPFPLSVSGYSATLYAYIGELPSESLVE
jgi:hypothetical protein